jgi:hypothetical protein
MAGAAKDAPSEALRVEPADGDHLAIHCSAALCAASRRNDVVGTVNPGGGGHLFKSQPLLFPQVPDSLCSPRSGRWTFRTPGTKPTIRVSARRLDPSIARPAVMRVVFEAQLRERSASVATVKPFLETWRLRGQSVRDGLQLAGPIIGIACPFSSYSCRHLRRFFLPYPVHLVFGGSAGKVKANLRPAAVASSWHIKQSFFLCPVAAARRSLGVVAIGRSTATRGGSHSHQFRKALPRGGRSGATRGYCGVTATRSIAAALLSTASAVGLGRHVELSPPALPLKEGTG